MKNQRRREKWRNVIKRDKVLNTEEINICKDGKENVDNKMNQSKKYHQRKKRNVKSKRNQRMSHKKADE